MEREDFSSGIKKAQEGTETKLFEGLKKKYCSPRILKSAKMYSRNEEEIRICPSWSTQKGWFKEEIR